MNEQELKIAELEVKLENVYSQRNELAIALCKLLGGRGVADAGLDPQGWGHVVYADLADGRQASWHIAPSETHLLEGLKEYPKPWDGTYLGRSTGWSKFLPNLPSELGRRELLILSLGLSFTSRFVRGEPVPWSIRETANAHKEDLEPLIDKLTRMLA